MHYKHLLTLSLLPLAFGAPSQPDNFDTLRTTNRVEGRQANSPPSTIAAIVADVQLSRDFQTPANTTSHTSSLVQKRQLPKGRVTGTGDGTFDNPVYAGYIWKTKIGNQVLNMVYHNYQGEFWVYSSALPAAKKAGHTVYNRLGQALGRTWKLYCSYASLCTGGDIFADNVTIGGYTAQTEVQAAKYIGDDEAKTTKAYDGVVAWGWATANSGCSGQPCSPWWFRAQPQMPWKGYSVGLGSKPAVWDVGFSDPAKQNGGMLYTQGYYDAGGFDMELSGYSVGTAPMTPVLTPQGWGNLYSAFDSDTPYIWAHPQIVNDYYTQVKGAGIYNPGNIYVYPCTSTLPAFNIWADGAGHQNGQRVKFSVPGSMLRLTKPDDLPGYCVGAIQPTAGVDGQRELILGSPFMKTKYISFSNDPSQGIDPPYVGIANAR